MSVEAHGTMAYNATEEEEILAIDHELKQMEVKIVKLNDRKEVLVQRKNKLKDQILERKSLKLANRDWSKGVFPWSGKVESLLQEVFKIKEFRPLQLEAINATLSKEDTILIMPTGGGKSLCYQLPALVDKGITLVVSPLVSLMEDQVMGLKKINYPAIMLCASSSKEDLKMATASLQDPLSKIKLIYVTPEKLAKSKRFMSQLQKCSEQGRFSRLAIDEVHCCSVWGHDFRPDYNFLGVLKDMFPNTPILGLTATATSKVTIDVQKMLNIQGCLILRATFNRPNLNYEVVPKPPTTNDCLDYLEDLLTKKFKNETGIIYTTAIKDCEELTKELKKRGLKAGVYHATLEAEVRSRMHSRWMNGELQVIVATIAFGLGIDKPNVRFVIHHSLSKSMENFYQESGRAGRDGKLSHCIVMYKLSDVFKLSTMVFTQQTGLENLYGILAYCLDSCRCRRSMIADHFEEVWTSDLCENMCDHCRKPRAAREFDATSHCRSLHKIIQHALELDVKVTAIKLIDAWYGKGDAKLRVPSVKPPPFDRTTAEKILGYLLIDGYLKEDFHYTAYSTISYLRKGPRSAVLEDPGHRISLQFPGLVVKSPEIADIKIGTDGTKTDNDSTKQAKKSGSKNESSLVSKSSTKDKDLCIRKSNKNKRPIIIDSDSDEPELKIVKEM